jgi:hypothetical protein
MLDRRHECDIMTQHADVAQSAELSPCKREVAGSSPAVGLRQIGEGEICKN